MWQNSPRICDRGQLSSLWTLGRLWGVIILGPWFHLVDKRKGCEEAKERFLSLAILKLTHTTSAQLCGKKSHTEPHGGGGNYVPSRKGGSQGTLHILNVPSTDKAAAPTNDFILPQSPLNLCLMYDHCLLYTSVARGPGELSKAPRLDSLPD